MPRSTSPRLARSERRRLIEDAATELFARRGYEAATVDEIVRAAGVTKPMLYRHFESKRELCVALLERHREELIAAPLAVFNREAGTRREQLTSMLTAWLEHAREHPDATRLLFTPITGDPDVEEVQRELHARQRATQKALLREFAPNLGEDQGEPMAEVVWGGLVAAVLWWLNHPEVPIELPVGVLVGMVEGLLGIVDSTEERG